VAVSCPGSAAGTARLGIRAVQVGPRRLEVAEVPGREDQAPLVFLHEGLGCVALWRSFPQRLASATGRRAIVYSRAGYGSSDPATLPRPVRYMHDEALDVLPAVLDALDVTCPVLVGHSDGGSIALIHAGGSGRAVGGLVLLAPHVFVEPRTLDGIRAARRAYLEGDLAARLGRYHAHPDNAFWGWNDVWLSPQFVDWNIEAYLPAVSAPALVVQGVDDPYGSLAQVDAIARGSGAPVRAHVLDRCGHSPHLEHPDETARAVLSWLEAQAGSSPTPRERPSRRAR
jgi:pimeloyl-ACP methyl ester carboxylesterase